MFLRARLPQFEDSAALAASAAAEGILIAPGALFRPHLDRSPWMRLNVTTLEDPRLQRWLERVAKRNAAPCKG